MGRNPEVELFCRNGHPVADQCSVTASPSSSEVCCQSANMTAISVNWNTHTHTHTHTHTQLRGALQDLSIDKQAAVAYLATNSPQLVKWECVGVCVEKSPLGFNDVRMWDSVCFLVSSPEEQAFFFSFPFLE